MAHDNHNHDDKHGHGDGGHYILPDGLILKVGGTLLVFTAITVAVAYVDLGRLNFFVAMFIASIKAALVAVFFMNLRKDTRENAVIFATSFVFLAIFFVLTSTDLFFRGDVYVKKGDLLASASAAAPSKLKKPWISTPELVAHGKELFMVQCVSCHGAEGKGDGVAAAALNPHPRNFTSPTEHWDNGRRVAMVFKTLKEGVANTQMASFSTLPIDDRWALAQYVLSLNPEKPAPSTAEDFAKISIDPNTDSGGAGAGPAPSIPVDLAIDRMAVSE